MSQKFKVILFLLFFLFALASILHTSPVHAATPAPTAVPYSPGPSPAGLSSVENTFTSFVSASVGIAFMVMLILIVWAGFKYLTSGGEPKAIQAAHQVTTWAFLGILFMAIAWLILQLIENFTGIRVTVFNFKILCGSQPNCTWP